MALGAFELQTVFYSNNLFVFNHSASCARLLCCGQELCCDGQITRHLVDFDDLAIGQIEQAEVDAHFVLEEIEVRGLLELDIVG